MNPKLWLRPQSAQPPLHGLAYIAYAALTSLIFADVLFFGGTVVLGAAGTDLSQQFLGWRKFGFEELAKGNLALWNPQIFGGAPYFGGFQAALLYPPNVLYLVLPLPQAVNWSIALHMFLMGSFTHAWMRGRGLGDQAAFLAGVIMMFGGTYFPHIYAGHLPNLCAMVWAPLVMLAIDKTLSPSVTVPMLRAQDLGWPTLGAFALAMQIFSGHPQYVFITLVSAGLYAIVLLAGVRRRWTSGLLLLSLLAGGLLLSSVQWMTGLQASMETVRSAPLPYEFASMFAFAPENLVTLVAQSFFGNMRPLNPYWGRWYLWEMSAFVGVVGVVFIVFGIFAAQRRVVLQLILITVILSLFALGHHTPVHAWLYEFVPGFNKFRGMAKFIFPASLFAVALAAHGFDQFTQTQKLGPRGQGFLYCLAGGLLLGALVMGAVDWRSILLMMKATNESYFPLDAINMPGVVARAQEGARNALLMAAVSAAALAILMGRQIITLRVTLAILLLSVVEMVSSAMALRQTFDSEIASASYVKQALPKLADDYRILNTVTPNSAMSLGALDLWGNDPGVVRRYAEFMAFTQGLDPNTVTQNLLFAGPNPLYAMLRLRYVFFRNDANVQMEEIERPMARVQLVSRFRVLANRDALFAAMKSPDFDPRHEVLLEAAPVPKPIGGEVSGSAVVISSSTDWLEIEANASDAAILLITDVYSSAWRAVGLEGSHQQDYKLVPANYVLRAIPLSAGHHRIRLEYAPKAFAVGKVISAISWLLLIGLLLTLTFRARGASRANLLREQAVQR
jgi:hypothetical protein